MCQNKKRPVAVGDVFLFASCKLGHSLEFFSDWARDREEGGCFTKVIDKQSNDEGLVDAKCVIPSGKGFVFMFLGSIRHPFTDCILHSKIAAAQHSFGVLRCQEAQSVRWGVDDQNPA